jgi:NDP-sugar pyrophosphorylase family protein
VGVADVKAARITSFAEKPRLDINVTTGSMVLSRDAVLRLRTFARGKKKVDLMGDFVPSLLREGGIVAAYYARGIWHDVGTLESYESLSTNYVDKQFRFLSSL